MAHQILYELYRVSLWHDADIFTTTCFSVMPCSRERAAPSGGPAGAGAAGREVWRTKGSSYADLYTQNVVINMDEQDSQQGQAAEAKAPKERPVWLTQSTVQGAYNETDALKAGQYHFTTLAHHVTALLCVLEVFLDL